MIVYCVTDRHLAHAVWEPLAEYAELQQYEQNHTQPKLHPATVRVGMKWVISLWQLSQII